MLAVVAAVQAVATVLAAQEEAALDRLPAPRPAGAQILARAAAVLVEERAVLAAAVS